MRKLKMNYELLIFSKSGTNIVLLPYPMLFHFGSNQWKSALQIPSDIFSLPSFLTFILIVFIFFSLSPLSILISLIFLLPLFSLLFCFSVYPSNSYFN